MSNNINIVTTTINYPTIATLRFAELSDKKKFNFTIVGDLKTPHEEYEKLCRNHPRVTYLSPETQEKLFPELSELIGWKTIQRRNIGFVYAYNKGASVIGSVDDDNIPYDSWGSNILVNQTIEVDLYESNLKTDNPVFEPYSVTNNKEIWQRGYPIEYVKDRHLNTYLGKVKQKVLIQNDLCDGDSDYDAIGRLLHKKIVKFDKVEPYTSIHLAPFNSQNTFLSREVFPHYSVWPFCGRMDDIWAGYHTQMRVGTTPVFCSASVYQERNPQDLITNLENEIIGLRHTKQFIDYSCDPRSVPNYEQIEHFMEVYSNSFNL